MFYWIGGVVCQMGDRRNPGNNGGQIEYKKALCSILKTFRQTTEGFRFIVQYLNGGAFDSPFSEKVEFCICKRKIGQYLFPYVRMEKRGNRE